MFLLLKTFEDGNLQSVNSELPLQDLLEQSPSLNQYLLNEFDKVWQSALLQVIEDYPSSQFPDLCPFPGDVDALLSQRFWENN